MTGAPAGRAGDAAARPTLPVGEEDHFRGLLGAPVALVEYGDFECPYTRRAAPVTRRLREDFGDRLVFAFRHFPLVRIHPHAMAAALAAEAAGAQGRFWEMHGALLENQRNLEAGDLVRYAEKVGLDMPRFGRDLADSATILRVEEDLQSGTMSGVHQTPTFFVNGFRHDGPNDLRTLAAVVEAAA